MTTAIVLAGAGARGAYEAGVLSVLVPLLRAEGDDVVVVGTSAGAINAAILAGTAHLSAEQSVAALRDSWCTLSDDQVFKVHRLRLLLHGVQLVAVGKARRPLHGIVDTSPLERTVDQSRFIDWSAVGRNVGHGWVRSAAVVATHVSSSTSVVFVQGASPLPGSKPARAIRYVDAKLTGKHVRASAAIPIAFPSIEIEREGYFTDGGVMMNTPIAPAIDLLRTSTGAKRLLIVGTHPDPSVAAPSVKGHIEGQPDVIDVGASVLHSTFIDRVAEDVHRLRSINEAILAAKANAHAGTRAGKHEVIPHAYFGPPQSGLIANKARDVFDRTCSSFGLGPFSVIDRLLGGPGPSRNELLSFVFFKREFLTELFDMGRDHARALSSGGIPWGVASNARAMEMTG
jgi:NTE family protein